jgi:hypothetical protein
MRMVMMRRNSVLQGNEHRSSTPEAVSILPEVMKQKRVQNRAETSVTKAKNSTRNLLFCYINFRTNKFPCFLSYPFPLLRVELNSVVVVRKRNIQTERPPLVCEVSASFCE